MNFACRPYHTFHGDLTCPSQTDYLNSINSAYLHLTSFVEAVANSIEEFYRKQAHYCSVELVSAWFTFTEHNLEEGESFTSVFKRYAQNFSLYFQFQLHDVYLYIPC